MLSISDPPRAHLNPNCHDRSVFYQSSMPDVTDKPQVGAPAETDPSFWLHDAHTRMRIAVTDLTAAMQAVPPLHLGNLPSITSDLLYVLDDLTKMTEAGYSMQPPGPPLAPGTGAGDNGGMEKRVANLETDMKDVLGRLVRVETKIDGIEKKISDLPSVFATKADLHQEITASTRWIIGWVTGVATVLVAAVFYIARNVH